MIRNPFEVIKQKQQIGRYHSITQAIQDISKASGVRGFYRGYLFLIGREIPFSCIQFPLYEYFKAIQINRISKNKQNINESEANLDFTKSALNGSLAGSIAGFIVTPIDVIKTRQMTSDLSIDRVSVKTILRSVYKQSGVCGFFRGASIRVLYFSFGGFAFFGVYEATKKYMEHLI